MQCGVSGTRQHKTKVCPWWLCGLSHGKTRSTSILRLRQEQAHSEEEKPQPLMLTPASASLLTPSLPELSNM